jgi:hypothetical protein
MDGDEDSGDGDSSEVRFKAMVAQRVFALLPSSCTISLLLPCTQSPDVNTDAKASKSARRRGPSLGAKEEDFHEMMGGHTDFRKTLAKGEDDLADKRHAEMMSALANQSAAMTANADTLSAALTANADTLSAAMTANADKQSAAMAAQSDTLKAAMAEQGETLSLIAALFEGAT